MCAFFFHAGMKAPRNEDGGRILLAVTLRPIMFHCAVVWISADFLAYICTVRER